MATQTATLKGEIRMDDTSFQRTMRRVKTTGASGGAALARGFKAAAGGAATLVTALAPVLAALAPIIGAVAAFRGLKGAFTEAANIEEVQVSLENFLGGVEQARGLMQELTDFSVKTPFETNDILEAANTLARSGIKENLGGIVKELGAVSKNGQVLQELALALAKRGEGGKFQTEQLNQFIERGVNLRGELEKGLGLTGEAFDKAVEKGLTFDQVTSAIRNMSAEGGEFFGLLEKQSKTSKGLISTLASAWTVLQAKLGEPVANAMKPGLDLLITRLNDAQGMAVKIGSSLGDGITVFIEAFRSDRLGELVALSMTIGFRKAIHGFQALLTEAVASAIWGGIQFFKGEGAEIPFSLDLAEDEQRLKSLMDELKAMAEARMPKIEAPEIDTSGASAASAAGRTAGKAYADGVKKGMSDEDADIQRRAEAKMAAEFLGMRSGTEALKVLQLKGDLSRRGQSRDTSALFPEPGVMSEFWDRIPAGVVEALGVSSSREYIATGNIDQSMLMGQGLGNIEANKSMKVEDPANKKSADLLSSINDKLDG